MSGLSYLQGQATANPTEEKHFTELSDYFKDKLWFQLTEKLLQLLHIPHFQKTPNLINLYEEFVKDFQENLNKLDLAQFTIAASRQHEEGKSAIKFLDKIIESIGDDVQASIVCKMEKVAVMVQASDLEPCSKLLEKVKSAMDGYTTGIMDPVVHSSYYKSMFLYYKTKKDASKIFRNALLYLSYTPIGKIPDGERVEFANDVSMAALAGKNIFNFGELLERDVVKVLGDTKYSWVLNLLEAFNDGDIKKYNKIFSEQKSSQALLVDNQEFLSMKVRILRLMGMVFSRPSHEREISFKEIAQECELKINEVEHLVMKAFSLGVMKGMIDQVSETVTMTWVQPRVLSKDQVKGMGKRLKAWSEEIAKATEEVEKNSTEILRG